PGRVATSHSYLIYEIFKSFPRFAVNSYKTDTCTQGASLRLNEFTRKNWEETQMSRGPIRWSERKIRTMECDGCGQGSGANYKPWLRVEEVSSLGRSRRVWSNKTGRTHHLLSDVEYNLFLALEWQQD